MEKVPWQTRKASVVLAVRVTPKAAKDVVEGLGEAGGVHIKVRVRAVPDQGAANAAVVSLIAAWLSVPKSSVRLASGGKSRLKMIEIVGSPAELVAKLSELIATSGS